MAKKGAVFQLTAEERDPYSFEFTVGRHKLLMSRTMKSEDLPVSGFCPVDFLMAGIAGCVGMTIRDRLEARGIAFSGLRLEAAGTRTEDWEKNGLNSVRTKVFVTTDAPLEEVEAAVADAEASCTVRSTIADPPAFETEVVLEKPEA